MEKIRRALWHIGLELQGDFKVIMPDCYVIGGDVNAPELAKKKLEASDETIKRVVKDAAERKFTFVQTRLLIMLELKRKK